MRVPTGDQFHGLDSYTVEHEPVESLELMERAATAIVQKITDRWPRLSRVFIFAGPGNNGGDGLAVARLLAAHGCSVSVWLFNPQRKLSTDCLANRERLAAVHDVTLTEVTQGFDFPAIPREALVVDALFGTGLSRPLSGGFSQLVRKINAVPAPIVSIDMPSGLMCEDNGDNDYEAIVHADLTLTMQLPKLAFLFAENEACVGRWETVDIRLSAEAIAELKTPYSIMEEADLRAMFRPRPAFAHKGTMGHALLVAGSRGMAGAAILAARGCLRSGVGKLSVHSAKANTAILQGTVPEAILVPDREEALVSEWHDVEGFDAIGIGPGLGRGEATAKALRGYLSRAGKPMVIDADALNLIASHSELLRLTPKNSILTPHAKELEQLVGACATSHERLRKAMDLATGEGLVVVVKGHNTAVCTPEGEALFCLAGNPGMATPGSGDALTGIITALLAQGYTPVEAAKLGVWLHATAGDRAADALEEECMTASDIIGHLPLAFRTLKNKEQHTAI